MEKLSILKSRGTVVWHIIDEFKTAEYNLKIEVSSSSLIAVLSFKRNSDKLINKSELLLKLKSSRVKFDNWMALEELFNASENLSSFNDLIIAKGTAPIHGKDATIKLFFDNGNEQQLKENEQGRVDYKNLSKFSSVVKGAILAEYIPETCGVNGIDVLGEVITAHVGVSTKFQAGKNTTLNESTKTITALEDGIPSEEAGIIKLDPTLHIENDLDLSVGNIDFSGDVFIGGDVLDGFKVKAGGNITINGNVGIAELTSGGKILIHGGVAGKKKGVIKCKNIEAKYLNEALVEASEEVKILKGIVNSVVYTQGQVITGMIIAGRTIAMRGIEAQEIGGEQGIVTEVELGTDYLALRTFNLFNKKRLEIDEKLNLLIPNFTPYLDSFEKYYKLEIAQKDKLIEAFKEFQNLKKQRLEIENQINDCELNFRLYRDIKKPFIISKILNEGVFIKSRYGQLKVMQSFKGPLSIKENRKLRTFEIGIV